MIGLENGELAEFTKFLKTSLKNIGKPIKIADVKKMYHLKTLHTKSETIWSIFKKFFYACVTIILTLGLVMIGKIVWRYTRKDNFKYQENFHRLELRQVFENKSEVGKEERSEIGSNDQLTPTEHEKVVHFPS